MRYTEGKLYARGAKEWARPKYNVRLQFMETQIRILRSRIEASRIVSTPEEKAELIRLGTMLGHDIDDIMFVVRPDSYGRWLSLQRQRKWRFGRLGRPPTVRVLSLIA